MNTHFNRTTSRAPLLLTCLVAALASSPVWAASMNRTDYVAGKSRIEATYKADKAACAASSGNARDICREEAKAKDKVALAELEYGYTGTRKDADRVAAAKADAAYAVAKERCDDQTGNAKSVCKKEAKAAHVKALADMKMAQTMGTARSDAADDKRDAQYKVEAQKCEAMAGTAKDGCMSAAKMRFGKS